MVRVVDDEVVGAEVVVVAEVDVLFGVSCSEPVQPATSSAKIRTTKASLIVK